jgi:prepilin-type N-terminal cleavage/methylation domain-containing protein
VSKFISSKRGFSLVELMIVIVLLGIIAGLGIANMRRGMISSKLRVTARELASDLDYTRSIAKAKCVPLSNADSSQVRMVLVGPTSAVTGYNILDNAGRKVREKKFDAGITADFSGLKASPIVYLAPGSIRGVSTGNIKVKVGGVNKIYTLNVNGTTGLITIKEN